MCGGSGQSTSVAYTPAGDSASMASFISSGEGQQYAGAYNPDNSYVQIGSSIQSYNPKTWQSSSEYPNPIGSTKVGPDVTAMMSAYTAWYNSQQLTQQNWEQYSGLANLNEGGEGDNTNTNSDMSQRNALLGSLAQGNPTTPTPGLGQMGTIQMPVIGAGVK